jgi:hypothetical protein
MLLSSNLQVTLSNLALFLHDVRREYDQALAVFEKAMQAAAEVNDTLVHHLIAAQNNSAGVHGARGQQEDKMMLPPVSSSTSPYQGILVAEMSALRVRQSAHYLSHLQDPQASATAAAGAEKTDPLLPDLEAGRAAEERGDETLVAASSNETTRLQHMRAQAENESAGLDKSLGISPADLKQV